MTLKYQDSLRTLKGAQAQVRFPSREVVLINENSYVVLKPEKILQEIQLLQGDLRASRAKVVLPQGTVVKPQGGDSDYQAKVRDDNTEVVFVYKGKVDVTAQGKTVTVPEGFGTHVPKAAPPSAPQPLKSFSDFDPANLNTSLTDVISMSPKGNVSIKAPSMTPESKPSSGAKSVVSKSMLTNYHMQLASDPDFKKIVIEKTQSIGEGFDVKNESIPDGTYYMRVAFIDALGVKGSYSEPSTVIKDTLAPVFRGVLPDNGQTYTGSEAFADVSGTVEGATHFSINDEIIFISATGRFDKAVSLHEGTNELRFFAKDAAGNETKLVRKVIYKK
jgi:mannose-6-phosphate isomerase-like protein (cupin superfamily)